MKIGQKLMLSNIIITVSAMIILSIIISTIVSNYIENGIKNDLMKANKSVVSLLSDYSRKYLEYKNDKISVKVDYFKKDQKMPVLFAFFNMTNKPEPLNASYDFLRDTLSENELKSIYNQDVNHVYETKIWNKSFLAYNELVQISIDGKDFTLMVTTLISNKNVKDIVSKIVSVLVIVIAVICVLIVLINRYLQRMITRPINVLVRATEEFALKHFAEKAVLHTGDEFETLAIAINNMAESLKRQDVEQKKFYENISHELKTPLTVISGYAQGIKTNIIGDNEKALDIITDECNRLKKQLENIIYLSKLDTIKESFRYEKASINGIITNVLNKLDSLVIINEIDIYFEPKVDFNIEVDEEKVTRAFINILSNCIKYTKDAIYITVESLGKFIKIEVSDNGNGFSESLLKNPFSGLIVGDKEGSGIGLSIVKKVIDGHTGKITLQNKAVGGAVFIIELPCEQI